MYIKYEFKIDLVKFIFNMFYNKNSYFFIRIRMLNNYKLSFFDNY